MPSPSGIGLYQEKQKELMDRAAKDGNGVPFWRGGSGLNPALEATKEGYAGPSQPGYMRDKEGPTGWTKDETDRARGLGYEGAKRTYTPGNMARDAASSKSQQNDINAFLRARASGQNMISDAAARQQNDVTRRGIASQAQGTGARYNPAVAMMATREQASVGQRNAAATTVARTTEQAAAQKALLDAQAQRRGQDQAAMNAGLASEGQDLDWRKAMESQGAGYASLGLSETFQDQANKQLYADKLMRMWAMLNNKEMNG